MSARAFPNNLIAEALRAEHCVEHDLQVMDRRRIAVQLQAARRLQHAVQFEQTNAHGRQVSHHVVLFQERTQRLHQLGHVGVGVLQDFAELVFGLLASMPGVLERGDLSFAVAEFGFGFLGSDHGARRLAGLGRLRRLGAS